MKTILPAEQEIETTDNLIRDNNLPWLILFADMIYRFVDLKLRYKIDWPRMGVMSFLITMGGKLTSTQLAQLMIRPNHSITRFIDSLEADGLVTRKRSKDDRRINYVYITKAGLDYVKHNVNSAKTVQEELLSTLEDSELKTFRNFLRRLRLRVVEKTTRENSHWTHYYRGLIFKRSDKLEEARAAFETFLKLSHDKELNKLGRKELRSLDPEG